MSLVILVSGGLDSTLAHDLAREAGTVTYPLFVDYGQRAAVKEWEACVAAHTARNLPSPERLSIPDYGRLIPSGLTNRGRRLVEDAFLPGRNMLFLLAGGAYAVSKGASGVVIGLLDPAAHLFPDQTEHFLSSAEATLRLALDAPVNVSAPLIGMSKADVVSLARTRGIEGTYSCHAGGPAPCGECIACREFVFHSTAEE